MLLPNYGGFVQSNGWCSISCLRQPIQIGSPMLDPRTGDLVLITSVSLDPHTGAVLPVGGLLLGESFNKPLSGRMARVGGCSVRGGKVVPHAGGFQALLGACLRVAELLQGFSEEWSSAAADPQGEIKLPGTELSLPALPGLEYPDPGGSGLHVPVLGAQLDWVSGYKVPLAATMEDADSKGDEEEWEQQCYWHTKLKAVLNVVSVSMERLGIGCRHRKHSIWMEN
ncbi:uncharacterized protein LOC109103227 isoform X2 [Cyprinus carpio]|uniref:Uncharacterized protein LOC109103227 isoform X2 n=1 Tax=Cyprinus carpio TaxID=7962 RepID=A0A9Q9X3X0_CYPCA|nr:uncharacterized protein LOC109103227 isoform X2 [Cyprinus carpio]